MGELLGGLGREIDAILGGAGKKAAKKAVEKEVLAGFAPTKLELSALASARKIAPVADDAATKAAEKKAANDAAYRAYLAANGGGGGMPLGSSGGHLGDHYGDHNA
jgi:hypothetical protein